MSYAQFGGEHKSIFYLFLFAPYHNCFGENGIFQSLFIIHTQFFDLILVGTISFEADIRSRLLDHIGMHSVRKTNHAAPDFGK